MAQPKPWMKLRIKKAQQRLMQVLQQQDDELRRLVEAASRDAAATVSQLADESFSAGVRSLQYQQARSAIAQMAGELWLESIPSSITSNLRTAAQMSANEARSITQLLGARATPGRLGILQSSMEASAARTFDTLASRIANDVDLSPNVYRARAYTTGKIDDIVNKAILLGKSAREIAQDVQGFINPKTPGGVRYAAQRLGRTELNNAYHETSRRAYDEAPFVEAVQWSLSGSHPRSDQCDVNAHQNLYRLGEGVYRTNAVPDKPHPNCFCFITPVTPEPDEFLRRLKRGEYECR